MLCSVRPDEDVKVKNKAAIEICEPNHLLQLEEMILQLLHSLLKIEIAHLARGLIPNSR